MPDRPVFLTTGMVLSAIFAAIIALFLLSVLLGGQLAIEGEQVDFRDFRGVGLGIVLLAEAALLAAISFGLTKGKRYVRPLMLVFWLVIGVWQLGSILRGNGGSGCGVDVTCIVALGVGTWYLYLKPNVVAYWRSCT